MVLCKILLCNVFTEFSAYSTHKKSNHLSGSGGCPLKENKADQQTNRLIHIAGQRVTCRRLKMEVETVFTLCDVCVYVYVSVCVCVHWFVGNAFNNIMK